MRFGFLRDSRVIALPGKMCGVLGVVRNSWMVNVGLIFRIKLILTIFGMDQQPDFLLGLPASSLNFQTASESRVSWCSVLYLWRGKFNPNQLCNAMQLTTSYIFRSAPPSPWLYSYSESSMHLVVCAANECCISKTTALRVAAEGYWINNSFWFDASHPAPRGGVPPCLESLDKGYQPLRNFFCSFSNQRN